jgi:hypothetical protein
VWDGFASATLVEEDDAIMRGIEVPSTTLVSIFLAAWAISYRSLSSIPPPGPP